MNFINNSSSSSALAWRNVNLTPGNFTGQTVPSQMKHVINTLCCSYMVYWHVAYIQWLLPECNGTNTVIHSQVTWPYRCSQNKSMIWCHCFHASNGYLLFTQFLSVGGKAKAWDLGLKLPKQASLTKSVKRKKKTSPTAFKVFKF